MRAAIIGVLVLGGIAGAVFILTRPQGKGVEEPKSEATKSQTEVPVTETKPDPKPTVEPETPTVEKPQKVLPIRFVEVEDSGVKFVHRSGISENRYYPAANGSGLAAIDYDLDGDVDLYFATGQFFDQEPDGQRNQIYRSLGDWKFAEVTDVSGLDANRFSAGIAVADFDADGFPDVYVSCVGENQLFHNQGDGTFALVESMANDDGFGVSAAFLDYDDDGLLDLYTGNYGKWSAESNLKCYTDGTNTTRMFCNPKDIPAAADVLYHNEGDGTFLNVTSDHPIAEREARSQGVLALDVNNDDLIDLYIGNDTNANATYLNDGNGGFEDVTQTIGAAYDRKGASQAGMGVAAGDVNRDGNPDLIVTNFENEHNAMYLSQDGAMFEDTSHSQGVVDGAMPWVGWGVSLRDFDLDGWCDLMVTNGHVDPRLHEVNAGNEYEQPPGFWSIHEGRFQYIGEKAGSYFGSGHPGRGLVVTDIDNDGDYDMVVGHQDKRPALLRNDRLEGDVGSIEIRLVGTRTNRDAIGAKVSVRGSQPAWTDQVMGGGSYLSSNDYRIIVPASGSVDLDITWPGGRRSSATKLLPGTRYVVQEPDRGRSAIVRQLP